MGQGDGSFVFMSEDKRTVPLSPTSGLFFEFLKFFARFDCTQLAFYRLAPGFFDGIRERMPGKPQKVKNLRAEKGSFLGFSPEAISKPILNSQVTPYNSI